MHFSTIASTLAIIGSTLAADHLVVVGNNSQLLFEPDTIQAAEGDTVTFKFWPKNHSVAQAAFTDPCEPLANGFWSGFIPSADKAAATTWTYEVTNASQPIWFYCTQGKHCQSGMVGVINPPANNPNRTIETFKEAAKDAANNTSPVSTAGTGGQFANASTNGTTTNAASSLHANNNLAFAGLLGLFAYAFL